MRGLLRQSSLIAWRDLLRRPEYELAYLKSQARYRGLKLLGRLPAPEVDLAFVIVREARGWILEAICREIQCFFPGTTTFAEDLARLPAARGYFFAHQDFLASALQANPILWGARRTVFFTHPKKPDLGGPEAVYALNHASTVVCMCSLFERFLIERGVASARLRTLYAGADPDLFRPHARGGGAVGFCMQYIPRKDPDRVLEIVRRMPHLRFILLGPNWERYERFEELRALPNFSYRQAEYRDYPAFYADLDVLVSPARLEGGPIPLLEAMMCNVVPVASRTGFAPDLIRHGENGFLFDVDASPEAICPLIDQARALSADVRATVQHLSWQRFVEGLAPLV